MWNAWFYRKRMKDDYISDVFDMTFEWRPGPIATQWTTTSCWASSDSWLWC